MYRPEYHAKRLTAITTDMRLISSDTRTAGAIDLTLYKLTVHRTHTDRRKDRIEASTVHALALDTRTSRPVLAHSA